MKSDPSITIRSETTNRLVEPTRWPLMTQPLALPLALPLNPPYPPQREATKFDDAEKQPIYDEQFQVHLQRKTTKCRLEPIPATKLILLL